MRLLFLTNYYPPFHAGGYEELCRDAAERLQARGHAVEVVTSRRGAGRVQQPGVRRVLFNEVPDTPKVGWLAFFFGREQRLRANLRALRQALDAVRPDAVLVWGMWNLAPDLAVFLEQQPGLKVAYYLSDYWAELPSAWQQHWQVPGRAGLLLPVRRRVARLALAQLAREAKPARPRFERAACVSRAVRDRLAGEGLIPPGAQVIYNGIDLQQFTPRQPHQPRGEELKVVFSGRISPEKGVETLLQALALLRGEAIRLTVVGSGEAAYVERLQAFCRSEGLAQAVRFEGRIPRESLPGILEQHQVMATPSTWQEPLPRALQEGMALGLAAVGSAVGGIPELIEDGISGLLFPAGDAPALANCLKRLAHDPALRTSLAAAGVQKVRRQHDIEGMVSALEAFLG